MTLAASEITGECIKLTHHAALHAACCVITGCFDPLRTENLTGYGWAVAGGELSAAAA